MISHDNDEQTVEKVTTRYADLTPPDAAARIREKYSRRKQAIQGFTDRVNKTHGWIDEAEIEALRRVGVREDEIQGLIEMYAKRS